ncbi:MAG: UDP-N-acetylmuramoyl-tripeptide--D-alanyl-D-alanine ligase [Rhodocyclaceae bacterium]|nr:UDP-N-acetylmuramoyl-tripeptide--D-alanyl-D-alanine ligase [Rhodocyclaceae bacterium]
MTLSATAELLGARHCGRDVEYTSVGTDSRAVVPGMLYVALRGARFDGHDFVIDALGAGAAAALVETSYAEQHPDLPLVAVADTRRALGALAASWRSRFLLPIVAITGSNGKTTVKEMTAAILRADLGQHAVLATQGNLNNDIGVPLMLLRLRPHHRAAVIEMGMNHAGEIDYLTRLTRPTVALVNNAQRAHLEGLGTVTDVARAKGEIFNGLDDDGVCVFNADDPHAFVWQELAGNRRIVTFGFTARAMVQGRFSPLACGGELTIEMPNGRVNCTLTVPGAHNAANALAAAAAAFALGVPTAPIARGLSAFSGVPGRLTRRRGKQGALIIDDTYNANPDSFRAAIDVLASFPGQRILVMGDMGEVGAAAFQLHDEVGGYAKSQGIDRLFALGEKSECAVRNFGPGGAHFTQAEKLIAALLPLLNRETTVLVKGSRFMRMENIVARLIDEENAHAA